MPLRYGRRAGRATTRRNRRSFMAFASVGAAAQGGGRQCGADRPAARQVLSQMTTSGITVPWAKMSMQARGREGGVTNSGGGLVRTAPLALGGAMMMVTSVEFSRRRAAGVPGGFPWMAREVSLSELLVVGGVACSSLQVIACVRKVQSRNGCSRCQHNDFNAKHC